MTLNTTAAYALSPGSKRFGLVEWAGKRRTAGGPRTKKEGHEPGRTIHELGKTMKRIMKYAGLALVSLFFLVCGRAHFRSTEFFVSIVPPYVPMPLETVYVTGVLEIIGAVAIWVPAWRSWAGIGLVALTVCVTPANIYMWLNPQLFPDISPAFLTWRLVAQVALLALIWWSTRPEPAPALAHSRIG
jgi:uncharacterized membrane protein